MAEAASRIAVLVPVCSRNQTYTDISSTPFVSRFYPAFKATTAGSAHKFMFFIGYDDDDGFYTAHADELAAAITDHNSLLIPLKGCQHAPATAWNKLAAAAAHFGEFDYYFQVGDDVILECAGWADYFIGRLKATAGLGVIGPCNWVNHRQRMETGRPHVIENAFIDRRHLDLFGHFFEPSIRNWYCDDWITRIYDGVNNDIAVQFPCRNTIIDSRYQIEIPTGFAEMVVRDRVLVKSALSD